MNMTKNISNLIKAADEFEIAYAALDSYGFPGRETLYKVIATGAPMSALQGLVPLAFEDVRLNDLLNVMYKAYRKYMREG